jgi:hypothetical protein
MLLLAHHLVWVSLRCSISVDTITDVTVVYSQFLFMNGICHSYKSTDKMTSKKELKGQSKGCNFHRTFLNVQMSAEKCAHMIPNFLFRSTDNVKWATFLRCLNFLMKIFFCFFELRTFKTCQSEWLRGLRHELSWTARTLGSWFRIPLETRM